MAFDAARAKSLFLAASDLSDPTARAAYLERACHGDAELQARVEALLKANDAAPLPKQRTKSAPGERAEAPQPTTADFGDPTARIGSVIAGRYKLIEEIGEGGMGSVYMAQQTQPVKRAVAVKIIKAGMDSRAVLARFEAERQALAMMDHPNIAKVLDAGTTDGGRPFFVMELVKGQPITKFCDERKLTPRQRLELFVPVCQAIQHAHQKGVIHRDIKPSNVLVGMYDDRPVPKVIDFGVAKAAGQTLTDKTLMTGFGAVVGTPEYMSPEQASLNNLDIDTRSDIYSLGVLLYELLTGSTPVDRKSLGKAALLEVLRIVREVEAPRPSAKLSTIDTLPNVAANRGTEPAKLSKLMKGELDWLVLKALEKDRTRRYDTANALARDVQRYLADEIVEARPPSTVYRMKKLIRRNLLQVVAASLVMLALVAGIVGTGIGILEAQRQRAIALDELGEKEKARVAESEQRELAVKNEKLAIQNQNRALDAEREAQRQAANSGCDVAQQLCESASVVQGLIEYGKALKFAHDAKDTALEEAIRWNIDAWSDQLHTLAYSIDASTKSMHPSASFDLTGNTLAVGTANAKQDGIVVRLYDAKDGKQKPETFHKKGPTRVHRLAWQPKTGRLAIYAGDGRIYLWRPGDDQAASVFDIDLELNFSESTQSPRLAFSPDGSKMIAGTSQSTACVYDVESTKPTEVRFEFDRLHSEGRWSSAVDWSRDGRLLLIGNHNGVVKLADAATGKIIREIESGPRGLVAVRFNPDGSKFATATGHGAPKLQVWETATGKPYGEPYGHVENVQDIDFSPDGTHLLAVDNGCEAFVWSFSAGNRMLGAPVWTAGHSIEAAFHPSGEYFLTVGVLDGHVKVWRRAKGLARPVTRADDEARRVAPFVDRYKFIIPKASADGSDVNATVLSLSPDGKTLIKYGLSRAVEAEVINAKTNEVIKVLPTTKGLPAAYWKPDGTEFVTARSILAKVWDANLLVPKTDIGACEPWSGSFRPDGKRFAIASRDYCLRFYDTASWKPVGPILPHGYRVSHSTFTRDGRLVLTTDASNFTRLWHPENGKRIGPKTPGFSPLVTADNSHFTVYVDYSTIVGYRLPQMRQGSVDRVMREIEEMTGRQARDSKAWPASEKIAKAIEPEDARTMMGEHVVLEMTVRNTGTSKNQEWLFLNSCEDHRDAKNITVAIKYPTPDRRKSLRIDVDPQQLIGRRLRITGTVSHFRDSPQIVVESNDQLKWLDR